MWVAGIMQGLMWRAYDQFGFLQYSFVESVVAVHPYYVIRLLGGVLFLIGALIMVYNLIHDGAQQPRPNRRAAALPAGIAVGGGVAPMFIRHEFIEKNAILLLVLTLITVAIGGIVEIVPLFTIETTVEHVKGVRPYSPLELRGPRHLRARGLLSLPQPADPRAARRGGALRPLLPRRGEHVRPSVPVGLQAHRSRPGARRRQVFQRLALRASDQPAGAWCRNALMPHYAFLAETPLRHRPTSRRSCARCATVGVPYTDDEIANAQADLVGAGRPGRRHRRRC